MKKLSTLLRLLSFPAHYLETHQISSLATTNYAYHIELCASCLCTAWRCMTHNRSSVWLGFELRIFKSRVKRFSQWAILLACFLETHQITTWQLPTIHTASNCSRLVLALRLACMQLSNLWMSFYPKRLVVTIFIHDSFMLYSTIWCSPKQWITTLLLLLTDHSLSQWLPKCWKLHESRLRDLVRFHLSV